MKNVGSVEIQLGREIDHGHSGGEVNTVVEKSYTKPSTQGSTPGKQITKGIGLEIEGATARLKA